MKRNNSTRSVGILLGTALLFGSVACDTQATGDPDRGPGGGTQLPPDTVGTEYLHVALGETMEPEALFAFLRALFDTETSEVAFPHTVPGGLVVARVTDPEDIEGVSRLRYQMPGKSGELLDLASVPVSQAMGQRFALIIESASERMTAYLAQDDADPNRETNISITAHSDTGGHLTLRVLGVGSSFRLVHEVRGPHLLIADQSHGQPATLTGDWTTLGLTVGFIVRKDQLNFFVDKAYGRGQAEGQSFDHFILGPPHDWLNVTVTPWIGLVPAVEVSFEAILEDGSRIPYAAAPASDVMGAQFIEVVNGAMTAMTAQEREEPGSGTPFEIPYFYDNPEGGIVQVRVVGKDGVFTIYYDLTSAPVPNGEPAPEVEPVEIDGGGGTGYDGEGKLNVTFQASELVLESEFLDAELQGQIWANVFRSEEVLVTGPIDGAEVLASIHVPLADLREGIRSVPVITEDLPAVRVKILGFCDVDGNADLDEPGPDPGDPVTVPFKEFQVLEGLTAEVTVPFDLVY
jgi:hypothetical protein